MLGNFGAGELLVVFLIILVLFGSKKIPDLAQGLGKGLREFKKAVKDVEDEVKNSFDDKKDDNSKDK
jgi:sec-independent protein translocase protein TatA